LRDVRQLLWSGGKTKGCRQKLIARGRVKILVPIKRVPDTDQKIQVKPDGSGIVTDGLPFVINPFDAIAVEEALRIREKSTDAAEVLAVSVGREPCESELRTALA